MTCLRVDRELVQVRVVDVVARLVIAGILRRARSRVKATDRLAQDLPEGGIITAVGEPRGSHIDALGDKVGGEELLDDVGAGRGRDAVRRAVAVKDAVVALCDHVEVEVGQDVVALLRGEVVDVVAGSDEALFFGAPPREADFVVGGVFCEGQKELEEE